MEGSLFATLFPKWRSRKNLEGGRKESIVFGGRLEVVWGFGGVTGYAEARSEKGY